jgi:hypothetical protein
MKKTTCPIGKKAPPGKNGHDASNGGVMSPVSPPYARAHAAARPSRPAEDWPTQYFQELEATGRMTDSAQAAGVSLRTVQRRRRVDQSFAREEKEATACCRHRAISELTRRAIDGTEEVTISGTGKNRRVHKRTVYSDTLLLRLLEFQETGSFRQKQQVEHSRSPMASLPTLADRKRRLAEAEAASAADEAASLGYVPPAATLGA